MYICTHCDQEIAEKPRRCVYCGQEIANRARYRFVSFPAADQNMADVLRDIRLLAWLNLLERV